LVLSQYIDGALQLVFGLLQAGCVDAKFVQQHFGYLAIRTDREFAALCIRLKNIVAKVHALIADEDARTCDEPSDLVLALATEGAAPQAALARAKRILSREHLPSGYLDGQLSSRLPDASIPEGGARGRTRAARVATLGVAMALGEVPESSILLLQRALPE
jgi:hypothetical protein